MAARNDDERIELQVFDRTHGLLGAGMTCPAATGPQALRAEDKAAGNGDGECAGGALSQERSF
jgi:hypothetical protein